jgi:hypothetical protein
MAARYTEQGVQATAIAMHWTYNGPKNCLTLEMMSPEIAHCCSRHCNQLDPPTALDLRQSHPSGIYKDKIL